MLNHCVLLGHLGADPEIRYTTEGNPVASFNLAFRSGKDKTHWIKVTCFKKLAETCEKYLHKGARIATAGYLEQDRWESNGENRSAIKLIANSIEFIKVNGQANKQEDDLPF